MIEFKEYPKIPQYRNILKDLEYIQSQTGQTIFPFTGYVKLHGTNAAVGYDKEAHRIYCQSRKRIITPDDDNMGFAAWVMENEGIWLDYMLMNFNGESGIIYGEWCGGNIQKGVALSELPKMFVIFSAYSSGWQTPFSLMTHSLEDVYHIDLFEKYSIDMDITCPEKSTEQLSSLTEDVEKECPVGRELGVLGTGEGIVWVCDTDLRLRFKVKGEKHSVSKVKTLAATDPEHLKNIEEFVEYAVTSNRLEQGLQEVGKDISKTGEFIGWVSRDIAVEEKDVLEANGLTTKDVAKFISKKARAYYLKEIL